MDRIGLNRTGVQQTRTAISFCVINIASQQSTSTNNSENSGDWMKTWQTRRTLISLSLLLFFVEWVDFVDQSRRYLFEGVGRKGGGRRRGRKNDLLHNCASVIPSVMLCSLDRPTVNILPLLCFFGHSPFLGLRLHRFTTLNDMTSLIYPLLVLTC